MLSPLAITGGFVVNPSEKLKLVQWHLLGLDTQLVTELPLSSALHTQYSSIKLGTSLARNSKRVGAAGVGPHVREGDLLGGALLEQKAIVGVEQENRESAMEKTLVNIGHQMACGGKARSVLIVGHPV
jgi:hypothetical protein